jgi:integrase/recombinase XerD
MASLRRRDDMGGKFELDYSDPTDGHRYRIDTGTTDRKIAELWRAKAEELVSLARLGHIERVGHLTREVVRGEPPSSSAPKLRLDDFEALYVERGKNDLELATGTLSIIKNAFASFRVVVGNPPLVKLTDEDLRRWKRIMTQRGCSKTTISMYQRALKAACNRAVKWKLLAANPFADVEVPTQKGEERPRKNMAFEEVRTLISAIQERSFKRFMQFLLYTGCRRNEILYLKRDALDLGQCILYIQATKTHRRIALPINKALMAVIREMEGQGELPDSGYLFRTNSIMPGINKEAPWHPTSVTHWFKKYVRLAGLSECYSLHSCRHTYATYLRSKGVPQDVIQRLLGHSSVRTTSIYDHSDALFFRQYADLVDFENPAP